MRHGRQFWRTLRRFGRAKQGATAVEFAMLALPFFMLLLGMAEVGMMGFAQSSLNFATGEVARQIRTGEVDTANLTEGQIRGELCANFNVFINVQCDSALHLDVRSYDSFVDVSTDLPTLEDEQLRFDPGVPSSIVMVRVYFEWPMTVPLFKDLFGNRPGGKRIISSTMLFRNEPYPDPGPGPAPGPAPGGA